MKRGLTATQLKLIAVIAMICDHIAWAAFDTMTPVANVLHFIGKLSIPLFCFIAVEGYQKTSSMYKYMCRLSLIWVLSMYPFYTFFGDIYKTKQNFIFDILLGLTVLLILDSSRIHNFLKAMLFSIILLISIHFCVNPLVSICFMVSFHHSSSYKNIKNNIIKITAVLFLLFPLYKYGLSCFVDTGHQVSWAEPLFMIGFLLAIPLIQSYNGKLGINRAIRYIFYVVYPLQLMLIKDIAHLSPGEFYQSYLYLHIVTMVFGLLLAYMTLRAKLSHAQISNITLILFGLFFMVGYYIELTASTVTVMAAASKIEFTGIAGMILGFTWFIDEFNGNRVSNFIYILEGLFTTVLLYAVFTQESNQLFYKDLGIKHYATHSVIVEVPGIVYIAFYVYLAIVMTMTFITCYRKMKSSMGVDRIRALFLMNAELFSAIIVIGRLFCKDLEYDLITVAIFVFLLFFTLALLVDDYFGNVQTAEERDPLTGLSNRGFFIERVTYKISKRTKGTLLMMDMDNFKHINDNYGHGIGDKVLIAFGNALQEAIRGDHYMSRLGGDEFCAFICDVSASDKLQNIIDDVEHRFHRILEQQNLNIKASISIGIATYDGRKGGSFEELYENADKALYVAKNSGKDQYKFYA